MGILAFTFMCAMFVMSLPKATLIEHKPSSHEAHSSEYRPVAKWIHGSDGSMPSHAIDVGYDGPYLMFICRVRHEGETLPGKLSREHKACFVASKGRELNFRQYEVLVPSSGVTVEWRSFVGSAIPTGIIQGGVTAGGDPLYIGRVLHEYAACVGKVQLNHLYLYITYGRKQYGYSKFEILVVKSFDLL